MNKVVSDETWITMFKFDEVPRSLEDFQERCNEYQSKESGLLLSKKPMAIIKVKKKLKNYGGVCFSLIFLLVHQEK